MNKFAIVAVLVLGLVGYAIAQDLDAPTMGTPTEQAEEATSGYASLFDNLVARLKTDEQDALARNLYGTAWRGMDSDFRYIWDWYTGAYNDFGGFENITDNLTPAETAAFAAEARETTQRFFAAGMN